MQRCNVVKQPLSVNLIKSVECEIAKKKKGTKSKKNKVYIITKRVKSKKIVYNKNNIEQ